MSGWFPMRRVVSLIVLVLNAVAGARAVASPGGPATAPSRQRFVVHEWGVWVKGRPGADDPRPVAPTQVHLSPPNELLAGLPAFVLRRDAAVSLPRRHDQQGWDKPVLHFYAPDGLAVRVRVDTPLGRPLACWPPPLGFVEQQQGPAIAAAADPHERAVGTLASAGGMSWSGKLVHRAPAKGLEAVPRGHWWAALREVPGSYFVTGDGGDGGDATGGAAERFLFYEATARQSCPLTATVSADAVEVVAEAGPTGPMLLVLHDGQALYHRSIASLEERATARLTRAELLARPSQAAEVLEAFEKLVLANGLTAEEARAMAAAWRQDLTRTPGFLLVWRMPRERYDWMFPLTIEPRPDEVVRLGLVFDSLPGQEQRLAWLPNIRRLLDEVATGLTAEDFRERQRAALRLEAMGDLAVPYLRKLAAGPDVEAEAAHAAMLILQRLESQPKGDGR